MIVCYSVMSPVQNKLLIFDFLLKVSVPVGPHRKTAKSIFVAKYTRELWLSKFQSECHKADIGAKQSIATQMLLSLDKWCTVQYEVNNRRDEPLKSLTLGKWNEHWIWNKNTRFRHHTNYNKVMKNLIPLIQKYERKHFRLVYGLPFKCSTTLYIWISFHILFIQILLISMR